MRYRQSVVIYVLLYCFLAPLLVHAYLGSYSRLMADDFCSAAVSHSKGIVGGTVNWYLTWNGRFSADFLDSLMGYIGTSVTPYGTAVVIILWLAVLTLALYQILVASYQTMRLSIACLGAAVILYTVLAIIPLVAQSLYWGQGMRSVVPPLVMGTAYIALISYFRRLPASPNRATLWSLIAGGTTFLAGGFSETYVVLQTSAVTFALIIYIVSGKSDFRGDVLPLLMGGLIGSLAAMAIIFIAPGNKFRRAFFPFSPPGALELLKISFQGLFEFLGKVFRSSTCWLSILMLIAFSIMLGAGAIQSSAQAVVLRRQGKLALVWLPIVSLTLLLSCNVPIAYGASLTLPDRTLVIPGFVLVCALSVWGYIFGRVFFHDYKIARTGGKVLLKTAQGFLLLSFALKALGSTRELINLEPAFRNYAQAWDEREGLIREAKSEGAAYVLVPQIQNRALLEEIVPDPTLWVNDERLRNYHGYGKPAVPPPIPSLWVNKCVRDYYGIAVMPVSDRNKR